MPCPIVIAISGLRQPVHTMHGTDQARYHSPSLTARFHRTVRS